MLHQNFFVGEKQILDLSFDTPEGKFPVRWEKGEYSDRKQEPEFFCSSLDLCFLYFLHF